MNISFVASEKYLIGAKVMLISFLQNNDFEEHTIFWLYSDASPNIRKDFCGFFDKEYKQKICPVQLTQEMLSDFHISELFGVSGFHKLFIYNHLPIKGDRILSLDADAVILGSLKDFYYQDMEGYCIASSADMHIKKEHSVGVLGLNEDDTYINLGNTLFYLKNYLKEYTVSDYSRYVKEHSDKVPFVAQDVLNVLLRGKIKICDPYKYNLQVFACFWCREKPAIRREARKALRDKTVIIHYVRSIKPWEPFYFLGCEKYFYKYLKYAMTKKQLTAYKFSILKAEFKKRYTKARK